MQSKEFAAPFEKVMILQIVLNLKKRLQEPSAGESYAARRRCLANCFFGLMQRHVASKSATWHSRAGELVSLRTLTSTKPKLRRRELNPGLPRDRRKY